MADLSTYGIADRDIQQGLITLKKGSQLLKYGRKGKPKFCPFKLSNDGLSLIWISSGGERSLKLASVSRIIPGQRTAVFQRYLHPEKDYLSFSLIYNNGKRSLDLICKDRAEAEAWIAGLKSLLSSGQGGRSKIDGWSCGGLYLDDLDNGDLTSNSPSDSAARDSSSLEVSVTSTKNSPKEYHPKTSVHSERSHVALDLTNMQVKGSGSDAFRVSVSSAPSTSSHGSVPDGYDALGDVYIWGEVICYNIVKSDPDRVGNSITTRVDVLLPRPLESNVVLDVHHIACGVRHAALVTRQGEVFTWGEQSGGLLGHGVGKDVTQPQLVESLAVCSVKFVACGEFHTCAVTVAGEIYTWGDGTHNAGLLGHGTDISHWIPKRIAGSLEGLKIAMVACGPWHTALVTSTGQLFTFGDGTFGVLGHGDREPVLYPREVESLSGLRTIAVACGVWHTAAVVEVIVAQSNLGTSSGKLFTWGDGDKNRLGHDDKDARLEPTCVPALIDYDFHKIACGHSLTVGLTTSGYVFTMGSSVYGQLGNLHSDGKVPCLVEDKLAGESVEEISCGAYHVAVLTSRNEVYTWGKGANGRLGHGDIEDRKTPCLVEALKDRHIKYLSCGSNYTTAICLHKWVSGADQSHCSACRQAFGFTRKRHNCYNCGLVHCHSCSSRKALRAALAPNHDKPYRVCDSCSVKLTKVAEAGGNIRKNAIPRLSGENKDLLDKAELRLAKSGIPSNLDLIKQLDNKAAKQAKRSDMFSLVRSSQARSLLQQKDVMLSTAIDMRQTVTRLLPISSGVSSRSVSSFSRELIPPRSATPVPTTSGLSFFKSVADSQMKANYLLNQDIIRLRRQVESLRHQCQLQEKELQKSTKKTQEAIFMAAEKSAKSKAAKEVIKSLTSQLKVMAERLPPGVYDSESIRVASPLNGLEQNGVHYPAENGECYIRSDPVSSSIFVSSIGLDTSLVNGADGPSELCNDSAGSNGMNGSRSPGLVTPNGKDDLPDLKFPKNTGRVQGGSSSVLYGSDKEVGYFQGGENGMERRNLTVAANPNQVEAEWIEQYESGVYITLVALQDGSRDLKRVRFSRRKFGEYQAEIWWSENREYVYEKYNVRGSDKASSVSGQTAHLSGGALSPVSQY